MAVLLSNWNDHMNRIPVGMKDPAAWPSGKMVKFGDRKVKLVTWPWSHRMRVNVKIPGPGGPDVCGKNWDILNGRDWEDYSDFLHDFSWLTPCTYTWCKGWLAIGGSPGIWSSTTFFFFQVFAPQGINEGVAQALVRYATWQLMCWASEELLHSTCCCCCRSPSFHLFFLVQ